MFAKKSDSRPKILEESVVRATLKATSRPSFSVLTWVRARVRVRVEVRVRVRVEVRVRVRVRVGACAS